MKYKVTTSKPFSHDEEWLFDTKEEAQTFVDKFYEAFPKEYYCLDYPYICLSNLKSEIEEVDDIRVDPYAWLDKQIKKKEEHIKKYGR